MVNESSVHALIQLMDDPDETIYGHVRKQLFAIGKNALPVLENSRVEEDLGLLFQQRMESLIHEIHFMETKQNLQAWINSDEKDLLKGALAIARYQYPYLDEVHFIKTLHQIELQIWALISPSSTAFEKLEALNKVLFQQIGLQGNVQNYYSPLNSYINTTLELRSGTAVTLSTLYSIVANHLGIPIYGVDLPNHFILAYMDQLNTNLAMGNEDKYGVLFYIDAYNEGQILLQKDIEQYLQKTGHITKKSYFEPCSNSQILKRTLSDLTIVYMKLHNKKKTREILNLKSLFE